MVQLIQENEETMILNFPTQDVFKKEDIVIHNGNNSSLLYLKKNNKDDNEDDVYWGPDIMNDTQDTLLPPSGSQNSPFTPFDSNLIPPNISNDEENNEIMDVIDNESEK
jgi:hypothetical protein